MLNRKFIHRTFLAAALTMSGSHATTALGFQQAQYQPGQPGQNIPKGNSKVTEELNRMFQENGQRMPSMNANELPNAAVAPQGQVRPLHTPNQLQANPVSWSHPQSKETGSSRKQSALGRFFGKLRGDKSNSNPDYQPPVPPVLPESTDRSAQVQNRVASPIPSQSGAPARAANAPVPVPPTSSAAGQRIEYTQPGSAPSFMSTAGAAKVIQKQPLAAPSPGAKFQDQLRHENSGEMARTQQNARTTTPEVAVKSAPIDAFEAPFGDSAESLEKTELLDLDSLIEIPAAATQPVASAARKTNPQEPKTSAGARAAQEPAEPASESGESTAGAKVGEEMVPAAADVESVVAPEENPFTGVQLNPPDGQFLESQEQTNGVDVGSFGQPAAPMEDFNSNLPAIDTKAAGADLELIETPAEELVEPTEDATPAKSTTPANTAGRGELQPNVDDSEAITADVPEALNDAETSRVRQMAEQERRQRQQRQIQARAGQTGFKGFCPVALRERRELVDTNEKFTSTFGLETYKFSSAESKAAFDIDPSRYVPAASGSDVVMLVNSGEEQAGRLDYALWYRDRLYLFRSSETMTLFSKDPQRFASQY